MTGTIKNNRSEMADTEKLVDYVLSRKNEDGGYTFCKPLPSKLPETYYAVYILKSIGFEVPERESLIKYLRNSFDFNVPSLYYVLNTLNLLGEGLPDMREFILSRLELILKKPKNVWLKKGGITATYSFESPNPLRVIFMLSSCLRLLKEEIPDYVMDFVRSHEKDGGYGNPSPNLRDTYYCLSVLGEGSKRNVEFILNHKSSPGFTKSPGGFPPYLEETFYALSSLKILGYNYKKNDIVDYISSLQNGNGGFRRSIFGGISTLENSFYAVSSLKILEVI